MRLTVLDRGHRLRARLFISFAELTSRVPMSDVPKTLLYRPEFLGAPLLALSADAMRGPSYWTAGEREYMAMSIARLLRCPFCTDSHAELTRIASNGEIDATDPGSARPELARALAFIGQVTTTPDQVATPEGVPDDALRQALRVALIWHVVNRLANAFGFRLLEGQLESGTRSLHRFGYRFPSFLTGGGEPDVAALRRAVFESPGRTTQADRAAAASGTPGPWEPYAAKVRDASYRVTDEDVAALKNEHSEDEIFEITVAAAVGAALRSHEAGLHALRSRA